MKIKNLEAADAMPFRQSMRKSSGYDSWDDDYSGVYFDDRYMIRFIEKNIGKQFNEVYANFLYRLSKSHLSKDVYEHKRSEFISLLDGSRCWARFTVIDGVISKKDDHRWKGDRNVYIYPDDNEYVYRFKADALNYEQDRYLFISLGADVYNRLMEDYIDEVFYTKHLYLISKIIDKYMPIRTRRYRNGYTYTWKQSFSDYDYFVRYNTTEPTVLKPGTSERRKYQAEKSSGQRKMSREEKRRREAYIDEVYQRDFERRKRMDAENDEKIIRHGFDLKTSFRKV